MGTSTHASAPGTVRQVAVPPAARALSTLPRIDYEDAFLLEVGPAGSRTAEDWARTMLEDAPIAVRCALRCGWLALGLILRPGRSDRFVLGWQLRRRTPDVALLGASSILGLSAEVLFERRERTLLFATFVQQRNVVARAVWAGVPPGHQRVVRSLLERLAPSGVTRA